MRAAPLIVLASVAATAFVLRATHRGPPREGAPRASLAGSPSVEPESLPRAVDVTSRGRAPESGPHMLHGDPRHSHRSRGHVATRPKVLWTFHTDGPIEGQVVAARDESVLYVATLGGSLWALDRSGHPVFQVPLGARAYATPCVGADGTVYVGTDGGTFYAIDRTGRVNWKLETPGDADTGAMVLASGIVVFAAGTRVYGVRPGGVTDFRFQAGGKVFTAPALTTRAGEDRVVVGSQDHHVYALTTKGQLDWATDVGADVDGAAAIDDDGGIFVGTDGGEVVRLESDGRVVWRAPVGGYVRGTLSIARNGDILAGVFGPSPRVVRVTVGGDFRGAFPVRGNGSRETGVLGGPLEDEDGTLVFGGQDRLVHAVGADGTERWAFDAGADVDAPISLLTNGSLIVATYDGDVVALEGAGGAQ